MSSFSWLDYAESDRRAAMDVIDLFREQDTRDELGLATIRDTFSDLLFPGTSAIQTRARYFLIVPWIYRRLERSKVESAEIAKRARQEELNLIEVILASDDAVGAIGLRARKTLKRLPSAVYWQGLGRLGIRAYRGGRDQYHRSLDRYYARSGATVRNDENEVVETGRLHNWDPNLPKAPAGFPKECSLALTHQDAEYLRERIMHAAPRSLLAHLVDRAAPSSDSTFAWEHPKAHAFPADVQPVLMHARNFSEVMHGASLLYNLILAELRKSEEGTAQYADMLTAWRALVTEDWTRFQNWDHQAFWQTVVRGGGRIPPTTRAFVEQWLQLVSADRTLDACAGNQARALIQRRERELKRGLARVDGGRALDIWGGAAGAAQMDYRWNAIVRRLVQDVYEGLERVDA